MKKQSIWEKPVTWGGYMKLSVICTIISSLMVAVYYICSFTDAADKVMDWFQDKFHKEEADWE